MNILNNLKFINPFSKPFKLNKRDEDIIQRQLEDNSQGMDITEFDLVNQNKGSSPLVGYAGSSQHIIDFDQTFRSKKSRIDKYIEMSYFPEINESLIILSDEAIVMDSEKNIVHLNIRQEFPQRVRKTFLKDFKNYSDVILKSQENMHGLYKKWLIEGELFIEWILNNKKNKIIGYKILPAWSMYPCYNTDGTIKGYLQLRYDDKGKECLMPFEGNQISYIHWDDVGKSKLDIRGYLEPTIRTYNQLRSLEDSLIIFRLVRAPERRVWNIEVGRMPNQKAEAFIKKIIHKYKRNHTYNTSDGSVDAVRNVQSLAEDFWFSKREGNGTNVETLAGSMNLGELDDVKYFLSKMYKTLKLPKTRWSPDVQPSNYTTGRDIDREELKFSFFVTRTQNIFKKIVKDGFMEQMKFKYKNDPKMSKYIKREYFDIDFTQANFFKEIKDLELMETRLNILGSAIAYVTNTDEPNNPLSMELVLRKYFQMNDEEYALNERLKKKERDLNRDIQDEYGEKEGEGGEEEGGTEEPEDKDKTSGGQEDKEGLGNSFGGGLSSPDKEAPETEKESRDLNENNNKDKKDDKDETMYISKNAIDFIKKPRKTRKVI